MSIDGITITPRVLEVNENRGVASLSIGVSLRALQNNTLPMHTVKAELFSPTGQSLASIESKIANTTDVQLDFGVLNEVEIWWPVGSNVSSHPLYSVWHISLNASRILGYLKLT